MPLGQTTAKKARDRRMASYSELRTALLSGAIDQEDGVFEWTSRVYEDGATLRTTIESQEMLQQGAGSLEAVGKRIAEGDHEGAARQFVEEVAFGPGAWENELPPEVRAIFVNNAPTFLDELQDPNQLSIDGAAFGSLEIPVRLTDGSESPPVFPRVIERLVELIPRVARETIDGAAHVPHLTTPERYVEVTTRAVQKAAA